MRARENRKLRLTTGLSSLRHSRLEHEAQSRRHGCHRIGARTVQVRGCVFQEEEPPEETMSKNSVLRGDMETHKDEESFQDIK